MSTLNKIEIPKKDAMKFFEEKKEKKRWKKTLKNISPEEWINYILKTLGDEIKVNKDTFTFKVSGDEVMYLEYNFELIRPKKLYDELIPVSSNITESTESFNQTEVDMGDIFLMYIDEFFGYNTTYAEYGTIGIKFKDYLRLIPNINEKDNPKVYKLSQSL